MSILKKLNLHTDSSNMDESVVGDIKDNIKYHVDKTKENIKTSLDNKIDTFKKRKTDGGIARRNYLKRQKDIKKHGPLGVLSKSSGYQGPIFELDEASFETDVAFSGSPKLKSVAKQIQQLVTKYFKTSYDSHKNAAHGNWAQVYLSADGDIDGFMDDVKHINGVDATISAGDSMFGPQKGVIILDIDV